MQSNDLNQLLRLRCLDLLSDKRMETDIKQDTTRKTQ